MNVEIDPQPVPTSWKIDSGAASDGSLFHLLSFSGPTGIYCVVMSPEGLSALCDAALHRLGRIRPVTDLPPGLVPPNGVGP